MVAHLWQQRSYPRWPHVGGVRAYPSVLDVPDGVDLAVLVVPADQVPHVVEDCARKRVRGLVVAEWPRRSHRRCKDSS